MPRYIYPVAFLSISFGDKGEPTVSFGVETVTETSGLHIEVSIYMRFDRRWHQN